LTLAICLKIRLSKPTLGKKKSERYRLRRKTRIEAFSMKGNSYLGSHRKDKHKSNVL
jgi:hypothetical protein